MSKIIGIGRRARDRAIASGDMAALQRAERWLFRGVAEQQHFDAAEFAEVEQGVALAELARIYRRDNP